MGETLIEVRDEASVSLVRTDVRRVAVEVGLHPDRAELMCAAASELGFNLLNHAKLGEMQIRPVERGGVRGLQVAAADRGPGMADAPGAFAGRLKGTGLGVGLAAVRRAADEVDSDVRREEGTRILIRAWASAAPIHPEIAIEGRPYPGETVSGDDACFVRTSQGFLAAVADGLGHGWHAREASRLAMDVVRTHPDAPLPDLLARAHEALQGTRGCAMTVARFDRDAGLVQVCGLGNIDTLVLAGVDDVHPHVPRSGTIGVRRLGSPPPVREYPMLSDAMLLMATDGMPRRAGIARIPYLSRHAAVWTAHHLVTEHSRSNDDVLVLVAR